jgi:hypothetical protein
MSGEEAWAVECLPSKCEAQFKPQHHQKEVRQKISRRTYKKMVTVGGEGETSFLPYIFVL